MNRTAMLSLLVLIAGQNPVMARDLVTIDVAGGARITVAQSFAPHISGFIAELCNVRGYCTKRIHCFARGGHVRGSRHYSGRACDFAQRGWNKTDAPMYRLHGLAERYGLRDGCTFRSRRDCGHIDDGIENKRK